MIFPFPGVVYSQLPAVHHLPGCTRFDVWSIGRCRSFSQLFGTFLGDKKSTTSFKLKNNHQALVFFEAKKPPNCIPPHFYSWKKVNIFVWWIENSLNSSQFFFFGRGEISFFKNGDFVRFFFVPSFPQVFWKVPGNRPLSTGCGAQGVGPWATGLSGWEKRGPTFPPWERGGRRKISACSLWR